jgi:hypothetical protein
MLKEVHIVTVIESERGWGSKVDEVRLYTDKAEAEAHVKRVNGQNTEPTVPDIYWRADMKSVYEKV